MTHLDCRRPASALLPELLRKRLLISAEVVKLADKAGVSLRSLQKFESGKDIQMDIFIKILIALSKKKK